MKTFLHLDFGSTLKTNIKGFKDDKWNEIRFDSDKNVNPDIVGTLLDMSRVNSQSLDAIYSYKNIELVYPHEVEIVLVEFLRVLNDDGFVVIQCQDIQSACEYITQDRLLETLCESDSGPISAMDILYGSSQELKNGNHSRLHKCGFTYSALVGAFKQAGFKKWIGGRRPKNFELFLIACKSEKSDEELNKLAYEFLP